MKIFLFKKNTIQCVPEKRKPINRVNFSEICNYLSEKAYIFTKFSLSSFFYTSYKMYWPCMNKHWPFQMVMSKMICAEWEFKGLTGSATFQNKGTCWKTFIGISFVSFVMFLLLRLLILTWISESELGHITQQALFKSFLTCMSLNCSLSFMHWDIIMCLISNEKEKMLLIMKYTVCFNLAWQWRYLTDKTGFTFYWDALYKQQFINTLLTM